MKNFYTLLMMSQGTPMILMGDEVANTQGGNNNAYCQDNEISWINWDTISENEDLLTFVKKIIQFNLQTEYFQEESFWGNLKDGVGTNIHFHGTGLFRPDWSDDSRTLVYSLDNPNYPYQLFVIANAYWESLTFDIPHRGVKEWKKVIDTYQEHPNDILSAEEAPIVKGNKVEVPPRTTIVLWGNKE
jgi:glycogen operon protein